MTRPIYSFKRGPARAQAPRQSPEHALQVAVCGYLAVALPSDVEWTASLSGVFLGPSQRSKAKSAGLRPGWPDLQFCINRRTFYIELKSPADHVSPRHGTLTDPDLSADQQRVLARLHHDCWAVCRSVEDVRDALTRFGVALNPVSLGGRYLSRDPGFDIDG